MSRSPDIEQPLMKSGGADSLAESEVRDREDSEGEGRGEVHACVCVCAPVCWS